MNFSDLTKTAADAWSFIWPPVLELSLLAFLLWFLAPKFSERIFAKIRLLRQASALAIPSEVLEKYGIGKLIPAFATFLVIFCFYVADRAVNEIGGLLPGEVTYREDILFLKTANPERFICFWNVSEGAGSGDQLQNMITDRLTITEHERGGLLRSVNMWDAEAGKAIRGLYFCKFFLTFTAITMIVEILVGRHFWLPVLRALVVGFVLLLMSFKFFISFLYAIEQKSYAKVHAAEVLVAEQNKKSCAINSWTSELPAAASQPQRDEIRKLQQSSWWEWRFYNSHYTKWIKRTLSEHFHPESAR